MAQANKSFQKVMVGYLQTGGKNLTLTLAGPTVRFFIIFTSVIVVGWFLYIIVFKTIAQPVELPTGITPVNPELDTKTLEKINNDRVSRNQYQPKSFVSYDLLFNIPPTPTPVSSPTPIR